LHVRKIARPLAADAPHDLIKRADFAVLDTLAGAIGLRK
jgi:hypothetical protein